VRDKKKEVPSSPPPTSQAEDVFQLKDDETRIELEGRLRALEAQEAQELNELDDFVDNYGPGLKI
jgi:hypothetical protein